MGYLDSGYIAKFYLDEPDSGSVRRQAEALGQVYCAALGRVEVATALHRKLREGGLSERAFREVIAQFDDDCANELWTWISVTPRILDAVVAVVRVVPRSVFVRGADAIHLGCARESGFTEVYTGDRRMTAAAPHFRLTAITVRPG